MHLVLCHGPIDAVFKIRVGEKLAWSYRAGDGARVVIDNENLFGGEKKEGGVSGNIDLEFGRSTQLQNSYLTSVLGDSIPAYRGVAAAVLRRPYVGTSNYPKPWSFEAQRVYNKTDGSRQWFADLAGIGSDLDFNDIALFISTDVSASMIQPPSKLSNTKAALIELMNDLQASQELTQELDSSEFRPSDLYIRSWSSFVESSLQITNVLGDDWDSARTEISNFTDQDATDFESGLTGALDFFNNSSASRKVLIFLSDGGATTPVEAGALALADSLRAAGVEIWTMSIESTDIFDLQKLDNTFEDGGVAVATNSFNLLQFLRNPFSRGQDMNPAHILRECLSNEEWGMGYNLSTDFDEASWEYSAQLFWDEDLGLSMLWDKSVSLENFMGSVLSHCDASLSVSRTTGAWVLKPIRNDYVVEDLIVLDESNIISVANPNRIAWGELSNSVTVDFYNRAINEKESVTVSDPAMVRDMGEVINAGVSYMGITNKTNATKAAWRDLKALSNPFFSCDITVNQLAIDLEVGDVFKFSWAEWQMQEVVMRISKINYGDGVDNKIRITCAEDVFSTPSVVPSTPDVNEWVDTAQAPSDLENVMANEAPYIELVKVFGQTQTDTSIIETPEIGYVLAAAQRSTNSINAEMYTNSGAGYTNAGSFDFAPYGDLDIDVDYTMSTIRLSNSSDLDVIEIGSYCQIGEGSNAEFARVDSVDEINGVVTIGRGCYDLPPKEHNQGVSVFFLDEYSGADFKEYVLAETVNVKVLATSDSGQTRLADAEEIPVVLNQRAIRPYAPGDLQVNGSSYGETFSDGTLTLTWVGRDRTEQTSETIFDHTAGNIGPEIGVTYRVRGYENDVLVHTEDPAISGTTWTPSGPGLVRVEVDSLRDGLYSFSPAAFEFFYDTTYRVTEEPSSKRYTEDGDIRVTED